MEEKDRILKTMLSYLRGAELVSSIDHKENIYDLNYLIIKFFNNGNPILLVLLSYILGLEDGNIISRNP